MVKLPTGGQEGGRGKPARLKTAKQRTPSQQAWLERQVNDPFSAKARAMGYRSRAAFKITEIDDRFHFLKPGARVVDLGLAPGGWTQIAILRGVTNIVGVDLAAGRPAAARPDPADGFHRPSLRPEAHRTAGRGRRTWCCPTWLPTRSVTAKPTTCASWA